MTLDDGSGRNYPSAGVPLVVMILHTPRNGWLVVVDIIGAGKLFQKEENDDTGIGLNTVWRGKIGVKSLLLEYG